MSASQESPIFGAPPPDETERPLSLKKPARNGLRDDNASAIIFLNKTWDVVNNWSKDCDK
jgi:hypothetical protein